MDKNACRAFHCIVCGSTRRPSRFRFRWVQPARLVREIGHFIRPGEKEGRNRVLASDRDPADRGDFWIVSFSMEREIIRSLMSFGAVGTASIMIG